MPCPWHPLLNNAAGTTKQCPLSGLLHSPSETEFPMANSCWKYMYRTAQSTSSMCIHTCWWSTSNSRTVLVDSQVGSSSGHLLGMVTFKILVAGKGTRRRCFAELYGDSKAGKRKTGSSSCSPGSSGSSHHAVFTFARRSEIKLVMFFQARLLKTALQSQSSVLLSLTN